MSLSSRSVKLRKRARFAWYSRCAMKAAIQRLISLPMLVAMDLIALPVAAGAARRVLGREPIEERQEAQVGGRFRIEHLRRLALLLVHIAAVEEVGLGVEVREAAVVGVVLEGFDAFAADLDLHDG